MDNKTVIVGVFLAMLVVLPFALGGIALATKRRHRQGDATAPSGGGLLGFDELFHPSAHEARLVWEAEQEIPAPAPTPDRGPGVIEEGRRIVIEVPPDR